MIVQWMQDGVGVYKAVWRDHAFLLKYEKRENEQRPSWHFYVDGAHIKHPTWRSLQGAWDGIDEKVWAQIKKMSPGVTVQQRAPSTDRIVRKHGTGASSNALATS